MGFLEHAPPGRGFSFSFLFFFSPFSSKFQNQKDGDEKGVLPVISRAGGTLQSVL